MAAARRLNRSSGGFVSFEALPQSQHTASDVVISFIQLACTLQQARPSTSASTGRRIGWGSFPE